MFGFVMFKEIAMGGPHFDVIFLFLFKKKKLNKERVGWVKYINMFFYGTRQNKKFPFFF